MGQPVQGEIKIRTLPRGDERKADKKPSSRPATPRWVIYLGPVCLLAFALVWLLPKRQGTPAKSAPAPTQQMDFASTDTGDAIGRHLQEVLVKQQMMRSRRQMENMAARADASSEDSAQLYSDDPNRTYGVQLDSEDTPERLYRQLNDRDNHLSDNLPDERISARLAHRKWINQQERAERIQFVRNFIRAAYDRGYQVELDQNLVVVGVRRITDVKKVDIDSVIDNLAKQGL